MNKYNYIVVNIRDTKAAIEFYKVEKQELAVRKTLKRNDVPHIRLTEKQHRHGKINELHDKIKRFRNHGMVRRDLAEIVGLNSRLDSVHAKILSFRLTKLNRQIQQRNYNISLYEKYLNTKKIQIIKTKKKSYDSSTIFITLCENRNSLQKYLSKYNIQSLIYYKRPLHMQKSLQFLGYKKGDLPIAENLCKKVLALPHHQYLKEKQVEYICSKINKFYN